MTTLSITRLVRTLKIAIVRHDSTTAVYINPTTGTIKSINLGEYELVGTYTPTIRPSELREDLIEVLDP